MPIGTTLVALNIKTHPTVLLLPHLAPVRCKDESLGGKHHVVLM